MSDRKKRGAPTGGSSRWNPAIVPHLNTAKRSDE